MCRMLVHHTGLLPLCCTPPYSCPGHSRVRSRSALAFTPNGAPFAFKFTPCLVKLRKQASILGQKVDSLLHFMGNSCGSGANHMTIWVGAALVAFLQPLDTPAIRMDQPKWVLPLCSMCSFITPDYFHFALMVCLNHGFYIFENQKTLRVMRH